MPDFHGPFTVPRICGLCLEPEFAEEEGGRLITCKDALVHEGCLDAAESGDGEPIDA